MYSVKWQGEIVGSTNLEKGDPPMGVVFGDFNSNSDIGKVLGVPLNPEPGLKGWEGFDVYAPNGELLVCSSVYLEQFDLDAEGYIYQITCFVSNRAQYQEHFQHHITAYEESFN